MGDANRFHAKLSSGNNIGIVHYGLRFVTINLHLDRNVSGDRRCVLNIVWFNPPDRLRDGPSYVCENTPI